MPVTIGPLEEQELPAAVAIFLEAFAEGAKALYGDRPRPTAMLDVWSFCRAYEPSTFLGARDGSGQLLGFAFFTSSQSRLRRAAIARMMPLWWVWRAITGAYGIGWMRLARHLATKLSFVRSAGKFRTSGFGDAQLLNIAVAVSARGRGVAKALVREGIAALRALDVREVRLEVRPDNAPAINAYLDVGFREVGRTADTVGEWIVMTAPTGG